MRRFLVFSCTLAVLGLAGCEKQSGDASSGGGSSAAASGAAATWGELKKPAEFDSMSDETERSRAIFGEMAKVLTHPRCMNCHPTGKRPLQGDAGKPHQPLVVRGAGGMGEAGARCGSCHGDANFQNVPGHPVWRLAPESAGWVGKSEAEICRSLKEGDGSEAELVKHMAEDDLTGWAWAPPEHLEPAPGSQEALGALTRAWVETGAKCPTSTTD